MYPPPTDGLIDSHGSEYEIICAVERASQLHDEKYIDALDIGFGSRKPQFDISAALTEAVEEVGTSSTLAWAPEERVRC